MSGADTDHLGGFQRRQGLLERRPPGVGDAGGLNVYVAELAKHTEPNWIHDRYALGYYTRFVSLTVDAGAAALGRPAGLDGPAVRATCAAWQLDDSRFVAADETECFVAWTPAAVVVAFRGTASPGDWLADLNIQSTKRDYGIVHRGFYTAFKAVEPQLRAALGGVAGRPIVLTGHSLGGALAAVAAAEWADAFPVASLYTYGQPATGKHGFANFLAAKYPDRIFRVVNDDDIVPQVPPTFEHVGRLLRFDGSGNLRPGTESVGTDTARVMSRPGFDRLRMQLLERRLAGGAAPAGHAEGLFPSVSDHSLDRYLERIARMV